MEGPGKCATHQLTRCVTRFFRRTRGKLGVSMRSGSLHWLCAFFTFFVAIPGIAKAGAQLHPLTNHSSVEMLSRQVDRYVDASFEKYLERLRKSEDKRKEEYPETMKREADEIFAKTVSATPSSQRPQNPVDAFSYIDSSARMMVRDDFRSEHLQKNPFVRRTPQDKATWRKIFSSSITYILAMRNLTVESLFTERARLVRWYELLNKVRAPSTVSFPKALADTVFESFEINRFPEFYSKVLAVLAEPKPEDSAAKIADSDRTQILREIAQTSLYAWDYDRLLYQLQVIDGRHLSSHFCKVAWQASWFKQGFLCPESAKKVQEKPEYQDGIPDLGLKGWKQLNAEIEGVRIGKEVFLARNRFLTTELETLDVPNKQWLSVTRFEGNPAVEGVYLNKADPMKNFSPDIPLYQLISHVVLNDLQAFPELPPDALETYESYSRELGRVLYTNVDELSTRSLGPTALQAIERLLSKAVIQALDNNMSAILYLCQLDEPGIFQNLGLTSPKLDHEPNNIDEMIMKFADLVPMFLRSEPLIRLMQNRYGLVVTESKELRKSLLDLYELKQQKLRNQAKARTFLVITATALILPTILLPGPIFFAVTTAINAVITLAVTLDSYFDSHHLYVLMQALYHQVSRNIFQISPMELANYQAMDEKAFEDLIFLCAFIGVDIVGVKIFHGIERATRLSNGGKMWLRDATEFDVKIRLKVVHDVIRRGSVDKENIFGLLVNRLRGKVERLRENLENSLKDQLSNGQDVVAADARRLDILRVWDDEFEKLWNPIQELLETNGLSVESEALLLDHYRDLAKWLRLETRKIQAETVATTTIRNLDAEEHLLVKVSGKAIDMESATLLLNEAEGALLFFRKGGKILDRVMYRMEKLGRLRDKLKDVRFDNLESASVTKIEQTIRNRFRTLANFLEKDTAMVNLGDLPKPMAQRVLEQFKKIIGVDYTWAKVFDEWLFGYAAKQGVLIPKGYFRKVAQGMISNTLATLLGDRLARWNWTEDWDRTMINFSTSTIGAFANPYFSMANLTFFRRMLGSARITQPAAMLSVTVNGLLKGDPFDNECMMQMLRRTWVEPGFNFALSSTRRRGWMNFLNAMEKIGKQEGLRTSSLVVGLTTFDTAITGRGAWVLIGDKMAGAAGICRNRYDEMFADLYLFDAEDKSIALAPAVASAAGATDVLAEQFKKQSDENPMDLEEILDWDPAFDLTPYMPN